MTLLDDIIEGSTEDGISTTNLLRKVQVAAHRLHATELLAWSKNELNGYSNTATLPAYRRNINTLVMSQWTGPFGLYMNNVPLNASNSMDSDVADLLFKTEFREPLKELEEMSTSQGQSSENWTAEAIVYYNDLVEKGKAASIVNMYLLSARKIIPKNVLQGLVDIVRNKILNLALELQDTNALTGEKDGPTTTTPDVKKAVINITNNIYGDNATVASGNDVDQRITILEGDLQKLMDSVNGIVCDPKTIKSIKDTANSDEDTETKRSNFKTIIEAIKNGTAKLANNVTINVATSLLTSLFAQFLGLPKL